MVGLDHVRGGQRRRGSTTGIVWLVDLTDIQPPQGVAPFVCHD